MKKYITESGSVYQVDEQNKLVRRLSGNKNPTPRQGIDGEWKEYYELHVDKIMAIQWNDKGQCTFTSRIVKEVKEDN